MRRRPRRFARHCEPPESRSGSTRASCGAGTPGTSRSASRSRAAPCSCRSSRTPRTIASRGTSVSSGSWRIDRTHLIAADQAFLLPVVIDDTRDDDERCRSGFGRCSGRACRAGSHPRPSSSVYGVCCPGSRHEPTGTPSAASRVPAAPSTRKPVLALWRSKTALLATIAVLVVALGYLVANRLMPSKRGARGWLPPPPSARRRTRSRCCRS